MNRTMIRQLIFTLTFFPVLLLTAAAQSVADKTDEFVHAEMKRQRIPGVSVAIVRDGKIIKAKGYGLANVELNTAVTPDSVFQIGSVSKQFIATGIVLLAQDGKLNLEDKINQHLEAGPDLWKDITIKHLLTHTSGLAREAPGFNFLRAQSDADVIKSAYATPLQFAPGEKWEYCNLGYFILADIIRVVSGKPWPEFMDERVFKPAGMNATRATTMTEIVPNRAHSYAWRQDKLQNADVLLSVRPSGAFLSTVLDLAKWDAVLYSDAILKAPWREWMWKPAAVTTRKVDATNFYQYGFGWQVGQIKGHREVTHGGSLTGFRSVMTRFIDDKLTIIVLTNVENADPVVIARGIAGINLPDLAAVTTK